MKDKQTKALAGNGQRLTALETVIEKNLKGFYEVGRALLEIRESCLYQKTHDTFEEYCRDRWDMGRDYAYKIISSSQVVKNLDVYNCIQKPTSESQARPLTRLPESLQQDAWQKAVDTAPGGKITARHVQKVVAETIGKEMVKQKSAVKKKIDKDMQISESFKKVLDSLWDEITR